MIAGTYIISGVLLVITAFLFKQGELTAVTQTIAWCVIFFFASAGASAGYLTASEVFPLEVRAKAIAVFFAIAQCFGFLGTHLYGSLIGTGKDPNKLFIGYLIGAGAMLLGGVVAAFLGVDAEGKSLEDVAARCRWSAVRVPLRPGEAPGDFPLLRVRTTRAGPPSARRPVRARHRHHAAGGPAAVPAARGSGRCPSQ